MLTINPKTVTFAGVTWDNVTLIAVDRAAHKTVLEWSDLGAYPILSDVPEQKVTLKVVQSVLRDDIGVPRPGESGELVFRTAPVDSDGSRRRVSCQAVVLSARHEISEAKGAVRTIELAAISSDGAADPISITDAGGEE